MKDYSSRICIPIRALVLICFLSIFGCGVITQESAQHAVDNAKIAIDTAKESRADLYSANNLNKAERLLTEAQESLSRSRRQRAYNLATRAEKLAATAEGEAKQRMEGVSSLDQVPQTKGTVLPTAPMPSVSTQLTTPFQQPAGTVPSNVPTQETASLLDMQNRIQAAVQALEAAQNAVQAARVLVLKLQVELGLSMLDINIQQMQGTGVSQEAVNLIKLWYDQARQAAAVGNYESAFRHLQLAQTYIRTITTPAQ